MATKRQKRESLRGELTSTTSQLQKRGSAAYSRWLRDLAVATDPTRARRHAAFSERWVKPLEAAWARAAPAGWDPHPDDEAYLTQNDCIRTLRDGTWPADVHCGLRHRNGDVFHLVLAHQPTGLVGVSVEFCRQTAPFDPADVKVFPTAPQLSYDEMFSGAPCNGCGRPLVGGPMALITNAPINMTPTELDLQRIEDDSYRRLHLGCRASRWSVQGGGYDHCAACCPPPPLSATTVALVAEALIEQDRRAENSIRPR